jgi:ribosome maturation factor RimP
MTRPQLDDRDPLPEQEWREMSSPGIRRLALQAAAEAVRKAREDRKKPAEETAP